MTNARAVPAQLTATFSWPKCVFVSAKALATDSSDVTSVGTNKALSPNDVARFAPSDVFKSHITTRLPLRMKRSTVAFPRPEAPPVTRATAFYIF